MISVNGPSEKVNLVITDVFTAARDVIAIEIELDGDGHLPDWTPGGHIAVDTPVGPRTYSLCGNRGDRRWRLGIKREEGGRGGSIWLHDEACVGMALTASVPRNAFALDEKYDAYIFLAGGIGITPILPMLAAVDRRGMPWHLAYAGRTRQTMAFTDQLRRYGSHVSLWPSDEIGAPPLATLLSERAGVSPNLSVGVYCCGPAPFLRAVSDLVSTSQAHTLHVERFTPGPPSAGDDSDGFRIVLARSGHRLDVPPGKSILRTVEEAGLEVDWSCDAGICGTCITGVLKGMPDHRDDFLTEPEREAGDCMCICVSRSMSEQLVLDL